MHRSIRFQSVETGRIKVGTLGGKEFAAAGMNRAKVLELGILRM